MKYLKFSLIATLLLFLSASCTVTKSATSKTLDIYGPGVIQNPVLVDLDVKETKVTGTASGRSSELDAVKQAAIVNALEKSNADILVEPNFSSETTSGKVKVTVKGFPATYTNFRPLDEKYIKLLETGIIQKPEVHEVKQVKKNNRGAIILGTIGALLILIGLSQSY